MHAALTRYIDTQLASAADFVVKNLPVQLSTNQVYESLLSAEPHVLRAFREAVQYLPPSYLHKRVQLTLDDAQHNVTLRLQPTDEYPVFLLPTGEFKLTPESTLGQALALPIQVASDWGRVTFAWDRLKVLTLDPMILVFLFPWLRELMVDFGFHLLESLPKLKKERDQIEREVRAIQRRATPKRFPFMSSDLSKVCQSGKRLFGQYRMLETTMTEKPTDIPITLDSAGSPIPTWLREHLDECISDWFEATKPITRHRTVSFESTHEF